LGRVARHACHREYLSRHGARILKFFQASQAHSRELRWRRCRVVDRRPRRN
jgi:hypothetical protein